MTVYHFPRGGNAPINPRTSFAPTEVATMNALNPPLGPKPARNEREAHAALRSGVEARTPSWQEPGRAAYIREAKRRYHYRPRRERDWDGAFIAAFIALVFVALFAAGAAMRGGV